MLFSRLKISTKLIISSAVFLIPVGVMIFLLSSNTLAAIRKNRDEQEGIASLRPVLALFGAVPRYMNVFLGFEPGDPAQSAGEVEEALGDLEVPLERYGSGTEELRSRWETLRSAAKNDPAFFTSYLELIGSLRETVTLIGERSSLILVSEIGNYYFVDTALSAVPEAVVRLS
ncbi:MAG: hypothetical protein LBQ44_09080, partial [Treponema sp.]|nr:hypothetical protein [Treponema sp.]